MRALSSQSRGVEDADDIVGVLLVHREPGQAGVLDGLLDLLRRVLRPEHHHIGAVDHYVLGGGVVELKNILDHFFFAGLNGALLLADIHHHADALFRYLIALLVGVDMYQTEHAVGGDGQKPDERAHGHRQRAYHTAGKAGHRLALLHGDALGHQLPEDQGKEGEDHGDEDDRQGVDRPGGGVGQGVLNGKKAGDASGKVVRGESRTQKARQGDADLDGGEEAGGRLHDRQQADGLFVALLGLAADHRLIQGEDGDFRGGEKGVEGDEYDL